MCSVKKVVLKNSVFNKDTKEILTQVLSCEVCKLLRTPFSSKICERQRLVLALGFYQSQKDVALLDQPYLLQ